MKYASGIWGNSRICVDTLPSPAFYFTAGMHYPQGRATRRAGRPQLAVFTTAVLMVVLGIGCSDDGGLPEEATARYLAAQQLYANGELGTAEERFRDISREFPEFSQARLMHAKTLIVSDRPAEAEPILTDLLAEQTSYREAELWLIRIFLQQDRLGEAAERLDALLAVDPQDPRLLHQRAIVFRREGELSEALDYLRRASSYREAFARVFLDLGSLYYQFGLPEEAAESLDDSLLLMPPDSILRQPVESLLGRIKENATGGAQ